MEIDPENPQDMESTVYYDQGVQRLPGIHEKTQEKIMDGLKLLLQKVIYGSRLLSIRALDKTTVFDQVRGRD